MAVRVVQPFGVTIKDRTFLSFRPGQIVSDDLAQELVRLQCPVVPVEDRETTICPKCGAVCSWKTDTHQATIVRTNAGFSSDNQYFSFRTGDVIHPWLVERARENHLPLEVINGIECPHCKFVWGDYNK